MEEADSIIACCTCIQGWGYVFDEVVVEQR